MYPRVLGNGPPPPLGWKPLMYRSLTTSLPISFIYNHFSVFYFQIDCVWMKTPVAERQPPPPYCSRQSRFLHLHNFCFDCPFLKFYFHIHSWHVTLRPEEVESPTQLHAFQLSDSACIVPFYTWAATMQVFYTCFQLYFLYFDSNLKKQLLHWEPN